RRPGVESVASTIQSAGSSSAVRHAFTASVVGDVPCTESFIVSCSPGTYVPGIGTLPSDEFPWIRYRRIVPSGANRTRPEYESSPTVLAYTDTLEAPPTIASDDENVTTVSVDSASTSVSSTSLDCEGPSSTVPAPSSTENSEEPPVTAQEPPSSAVPQPFDSDRSKSSSATTTSAPPPAGSST